MVILLLYPSYHNHDTVVHPKERAVAILAQFYREMALIKEWDNHREDGIEVSCLPSVTLGSTHRELERISTPTCDPTTTLQVVLTT